MIEWKQTEGVDLPSECLVSNGTIWIRAWLDDNCIAVGERDPTYYFFDKSDMFSSTSRHITEFSVEWPWYAEVNLPCMLEARVSSG